MFGFGPAAIVGNVMKGAGYLAIAAVGLTVIHELQAAEGRKVKLHVLEESQKLERKFQMEEIAQLKYEVGLNEELQRTAGRVEARPKQDVEGLPKCPVNCLLY